MLVDALMYHGEEAALVIRLHTTQPDACVVVEGDRTFQGERKTPTFDAARWGAAFPGIRFYHYTITLARDRDPWENEHILRNTLGELAADWCRGNNDALVFLSDADEFATRLDIETFAVPTGPVWLPTKRHYYWTVDWEFTTGNYHCAPFVVPGHMLLGNNAQKFRLGSDVWESVECGWEFSFLGGIDFAQEKYRSFSHSELNHTAVTNADRIADAIKNGLDPSPERGATLLARDPADPLLPLWIRENQDWVHQHKLSRLDW